MTTKEVIEQSVRKLSEAIDQRDSWKGNRKQAKSIQRFLVSFSTFLDQYSGIIEILKLVDNNFGAMAYSTLSIFLKVSLLSVSKRINMPITKDCRQQEGYRRKDPR
jgi:hypothetical protein